MSEEQTFEQLFNESLEHDSNIRPGEIVKGKVISVKADEIVLNIGQRAMVSSPEPSTQTTIPLILPRSSKRVMSLRQRFSRVRPAMSRFSSPTRDLLPTEATGSLRMPLIIRRF